MIDMLKRHEIQVLSAPLHRLKAMGSPAD